MIDDELVRAHRERALRPEKPVVHGTAQNPDVFFQGREACNAIMQQTPAIVRKLWINCRNRCRSYHF
jgi:pyruvate-ferredoxin/flavodoxin oxidoreductase